jgi:hypothetical protein
MLRSENLECPFCGGTPMRKSPKSERMSKIGPNVGVQGISAGVNMEFQSSSSKEEYFYCSGCNQEYICASIDINLILTNFCTDRKEEIADKVRHYYENQVTLTDLLRIYRTGIVRRHRGTVPYISDKLARRSLYICFNYKGKRTFGTFVRSKKNKDCYTMTTLEVIKI